MREQVLAVIQDASLKPHEKFNKLMALLRQTKGNNPINMRYYNQTGANSETIQNLVYDLQQLYGISDKEARKRIDVEATKNTQEELKVLSEEQKTQLLATDIEGLNYHKELKPLASEISVALGVELESQKGDVLKAFLSSEKEKLVAAIEVKAPEFVNPFTEASEEAKVGLKFRQEFSFLSEDDCPDKLKILAADKITAFHKVIDAREELFKDKNGEKLSEEKILELCKGAVENFEENDLIYQELNYYKANKEILGKHPIFAEEMLQQEVEAMNSSEAKKALTSTKGQITKETNKLGKAKDEDTKATIQKVVDDLEKKKALLTAKLGADEK